MSFVEISSSVMTLMGGTTLFCASEPNDVNQCGFVGTLRTNKPIEEGHSKPHIYVDYFEAYNFHQEALTFCAQNLKTNTGIIILKKELNLVSHAQWRTSNLLACLRCLKLKE